MGIAMVRILGIVNITADSFSDGGRYLDPARAVEQGRRLMADGADIIDLGAESTHPDSQRVSAEDEIARLTPVIEALRASAASISVDTCKPAVMQHVLKLGVDLINDVTALADPESVRVLRDSPARIVLMHAIRAKQSDSQDGRAGRSDTDPRRIVPHVVSFFEQRIAQIEAAGISRQRLILDPGMGFFLGRDPAVSVAMLRGLGELRRFGCPLLVCTSRKSFLGSLTGGEMRPPEQRGPATLASELWAASRVDYIRTHDVRALRDALRVWTTLDA
ncbi:MAG: dihydropteroate synthase [Planctomycetes bacterium]|nr:dihydropteroate synthase [Planctomycetota bacterium]